jgi:two-component sensor histidine kinase
VPAICGKLLYHWKQLLRLNKRIATFTAKYRLMEILRSVMDTGAAASLGSQDIRKLRVLNLFAFSAMLITYAFSGLTASYGFQDLFIIDFIYASFLGVPILLNKLYMYKASKALLFCVFPVMLLYYPVYVGNIGTEYYYFVFYILAFYVFDSWLAIMLLSALYSAVFIASKFAIAETVYNPRYAILETVHYYPSLVLSILMILAATALFKQETIAQSLEIEKQNAQLADKLTELARKNIFARKLLHELNHRVKNNLQLISSLFTMQEYETPDTATKTLLREARSRIEAVSIMHKGLYENNGMLDTELAQYIKELASHINQGLGQGIETEVSPELEKVSLKIEDAVHVGLLANELITNAAKHGRCPCTGKLRAKLYLGRQSGNLLVRVSDSGKGFGEGFSPAASFGLTLVNAIIEQHGGSISFTSSGGAIAEAQLPILGNENQ